MASSDLRVGGLLSGTDVQGIIDKILAARAKQVESKQAEIDEINEKIAAWADINTYMTDLTTSLNTLRTWETWNKMTATSSDTTRLTATATTAAVNATYYINISRLAQAHSVASDRAAELFPGATSTTDLVAAGVLNAGDAFTIEGQTITIGATESLSSLMDKINTAASSMPAANRVTASIMDNRLVITRLNAGTTEITMSETTGTPLQALHIFAPGTSNYENELMAAQDAEFTVNGATVNRNSNTGLTDVITGVTLNLLNTTTSQVTLTVEQDKETAKSAILDFIDKYNAAAAKLTEYGQITLTNTGTGESQLDTVGVLNDDSLVREILFNMRKYATGSKYPYLNQINAAYTYNGQTGICDNLSTVGITTVSETNELSLSDEDRLDYMLENYYDEVEQLFRGVYDATEGYTHGVASDFYEYSNSITTSMTGAIARRDAYLDEQVADIQESIDKLLDMIEEEEDRLWSQFAAMEDAIADMQSQLSYLTSQLGIK